MNQHPAVTAQGRKVTTTVLPKKLSMEQSDEIAKPWKGRQNAAALELLHWTLVSVDDKAIEQHWPLLLPPLLSITDDTDTKFKALLLSRTGLSEVLEEALMPCLGYLPSLTPEDESVNLLSEAYPALIALSRTMDDQNKNKNQILGFPPRRIQLLDTVVRKGILTAYTYCSENINVVEVLLRSLTLVVDELGIESVKHLKHVLPMLSEVLGNPFGHAHPPALLAATKSLQSVILNGWPRMVFNRGEVLKGVTLCWIHIQDEQLDGLEDVRKELKRTVLMLKDAVGLECDVPTDFKALVEADPRLEGLFSYLYS